MARYREEYNAYPALGKKTPTSNELTAKLGAVKKSGKCEVIPPT